MTGANPQTQTVTAGPTGQAVFTYTGAKPGQDTIVATTGSGSGALTSNPATVNWTQPPSIRSANSATFAAGQPGSFTVTTTGAPTAKVTETGTLPAGVSFTAADTNGTATISGTPAPGSGGTYIISLRATNGVAPDATQTFTLTVDQAPAITISGDTAFTAGQSGGFTVTSSGTPTAKVTETGTLPSGVSFTADNTTGTATISGTPASGSSGTYPISLDASNGVAPDASQAVTLTVGQAATTTQLTSSANPSDFGQSITFTATVAPAAPNALTPTGTVTFSDGGTEIGTGTLNGGSTTFATDSLAVGDAHTITASYGGDANFTASGTTSALTQTVDLAPTTLVLSSVSDTRAPCDVGPHGDGRGCPPKRGEPGPGDCRGNHGAVHGGCPDGAGSHSDHLPPGLGSGLDGHRTVAGTVYQPPVPDTALLGQPVTLTATVAVAAPGTTAVTSPTGTVTFLDGGTTLGQAALTTTAGVTSATLTVSNLPAGAQSLSAKYAGDGNFAASQGSLTEQVDYVFVGPLPPLGDPHHRTVDANRTVPVSFVLLDAQGHLIRTATATLSVDGRPATPQGSLNSGDIFRRVGDHYQYDLKLRDQGVTGGTVTLTIQLSDGTTHSFTLTVAAPPKRESPDRH